MRTGPPGAPTSTPVRRSSPNIAASAPATKSVSAPTTTARWPSPARNTHRTPGPAPGAPRRKGAYRVSHLAAPPPASAPPPPHLRALLASAARGAALEQAEQDAYHAYWAAPTDDATRFHGWLATLAALHTARQVDAALRAAFAPPPL